jgi:hypothetical protein
MFTPLHGERRLQNSRFLSPASPLLFDALATILGIVAQKQQPANAKFGAYSLSHSRKRAIMKRRFGVQRTNRVRLVTVAASPDPSGLGNINQFQ